MRKLTLDQARARYQQRFTKEHVPQWARDPSNVAQPQFATDQSWYENTIFPGETREVEGVEIKVHGNAAHCHTSNCFTADRLNSRAYYVGYSKRYAQHLARDLKEGSRWISSEVLSAAQLSHKLQKNIFFRGYVVVDHYWGLGGAGPLVDIIFKKSLGRIGNVVPFEDLRRSKT